jgi:hypothetical protein
MAESRRANSRCGMGTWTRRPASWIVAVERGENAGGKQN